MREEIITIGEVGVIIGILTQAQRNHAPSPVDHGALTNTKPVVLLSNAGLLHKVGPYRQWVDLARLLSEDGFSVFRFDLTGLGDSDLPTDSLPDAERPVHEIRRVMDHLEMSTGANQFIVMGLCSGADLSFSTALADDRVVGTVLIDGLAYRTLGWYVQFILPRILDVKGWYRRTRILFRSLKYNKFSQSHDDIIDGGDSLSMRNIPTLQKAQIDINHLVDHGVEILFIYTNGVSNAFNHPKQFRAMFPDLDWKDKIQVEYLPEINHMCTSLEHRERLQELIRCWMMRYSQHS